MSIGFRTDEKGQFIWPGFGDNLRVLEWVLKRCEGSVEAQKTPIGYVPNPSDIDVSGLDLPKGTMESLLTVNNDEWSAELSDQEKFFQIFGSRLPKELGEELNAQKKRVG